MTGPDVADLSPGSVLIAGTTGWRYRVQAADPEADRVVLRGPHGAALGRPSRDSARYRER